MGIVGWLLLGSIPGVLIGGRLSLSIPDTLLRFALATVLGLSGLKLIDVPGTSDRHHRRARDRDDGAARLPRPAQLGALPARPKQPRRTRSRVDRPYRAGVSGGRGILAARCVASACCRLLSSWPCSRARPWPSLSARGSSCRSGRSRRRRSTKVFSPVCRCPQARALIKLRLLRRDTITVTIVDSSGREVRRLVDHKRFNVGLHHFTWDGRDAAGKVLLSGSYRPKVAFSDIRPHLRAAEPDPHRRQPADADRRVREAASVLAGRRRARRRHHRELPRERARARPAARERPPAGAHVPGAARGLAGLERDDARREAPSRHVPALARRARPRRQPLAGGSGRNGPAPLPGPAQDARRSRRRSHRPRSGRHRRQGRALDWSGTARASSGRAAGRAVVVVRAPKKAGRYVLALDAAGHRLRTDLVVKP